MNNKKIARLLLMFGIMFISLIVHITALDLTQHDKYATSTASERKEYVRRGSIYDRNGVLLAQSNGDVKNQTREYPYKEKYAHVIGYLSDTHNTNEIEKIYNAALLGESNTPFVGGVVTFLDDAKFAMSGQNEKRGSDLTLTINNELQIAAHEALGSYKGSVVVMDPRSGEVLAMVSKPDFDPSPQDLAKTLTAATEADDGSLKGRATKEIYAPGSTFKIIVTAAMLENGMEDFTIDSETELKTEVKEYGQSTQNVSGLKDLETGFKTSSNIYFAQAGIELGKDAILNTARNFLFEEKITFDGFGVAQNTLPKDENVTGYRALSNLSLGQGDVSTTPLHLAMIASAIANEGVMMQPYIVSKISSPSYYTAKPRIITRSTGISTAHKIKDLMKLCVESGTGTGAYIWGKDVCGKTGTAEVDTTKGTAHAHFIGFAPYDYPEVAIAVVLENLPDGHTGGAKAAPIAKKVLEKYFEINK